MEPVTEEVTPILSHPANKKSLAKRTIIGIFWNFSEQMSRRGINIIITLLLARFLAPSDYGLIAMMSVFLAIGTSLMDSGFRQSLIRIKNATPDDYNTAFYSNLGLGLLSYLLLFFSAPLISNFYHEPKLTLLIRVTSLTIIISSFQLVQLANLSRALNFKAQLQSSFPAGIISGLIAVGLAYLNFGVWALVIQMLLAALIKTVLLWFIQGWRPSILFSRTSFLNCYSFGYKLFLSGVIDILFKNIYVMIIAKIFSASLAGYYFFAYKIKDLFIHQLVSAIQNVTYPALSAIQDDPIKLKSGYRKLIGVTTFLLSPTMLLLASVADPIFRILLPAKWLPAVPYLQLMCLEAVLYPLHSINLNILKVMGRSDLFLNLEIIKKTMVAVIILISIKFGIYGILVGQIAVSILGYIPNSFFSSRLINYPVREQVMDFGPNILLSLIIAAGIYLAVIHFKLSALMALFIFGTSGALLFILISYILRLQYFVVIFKMIKSRFANRRGIVNAENQV